MEFIADCMLGRLAKWLKILGFDVLYFPKAEDKDLVEISRREKRVLLTRDTGLIEKTKRRAGRLFIESDDWREQVVQVLDEYGLWDSVRPNSRCLDCNKPLKPLPKSRARNLVPPHILDTAPSFAMCPGCGRVFWPGTHYGDMEARIAALRRRSGRGQTSLFALSAKREV
ncbi:MAG: hypothetical protein FJY79_03715 [Candidatus Aminicenantes bacterium]|nr:hypothetical protein [Candidatus Aminicenantes bacterium]